MTPDLQTVLEPWICLHRGHAAVRRSVATKLHLSHGLTINDYEALALLARAKGNQLRRVDLAKELQLTASGVTRLLDGLEQNGLVRSKACSTDGRVSYAELTNTGRRTLEQASAVHMTTIRTLFEERYTVQELSLLAELLARLHEPQPGL